MDDVNKHLIILADSGMGKTSLLINYFVHNLRKSKFKRTPIILAHLGLSDVDDQINAIPYRGLQVQYQAPHKDQHILNIPTQEDSAIFLDALDEDTKAIDDHAERVRDLMDMCRRYRKVVLTCRTQFFPKEEEIPLDTGVIVIGPRKPGQKNTYRFWKYYISPFNDEDIIKFLKARFPIWKFKHRKKAFELVKKIPYLNVRPMLLTHIPDVMSANKDINKTYELYEILINAWLSRETNWADEESLRDFSEILAVDLYNNRIRRGGESAPENELYDLAVKNKFDLRPWQIRSRSLLNRDAVGNYKFSHRSIMEYLYVAKLLQGHKICEGIPLTDMMKRFLLEMLCSHGELATESISWILSNSIAVIYRGEIDKYSDEVAIKEKATLIKVLMHLDPKQWKSIINILGQDIEVILIDNTLELVNENFGVLLSIVRNINYGTTINQSPSIAIRKNEFGDIVYYLFGEQIQEIKRYEKTNLKSIKKKWHDNLDILKSISNEIQANPQFHVDDGFYSCQQDIRQSSPYLDLELPIGNEKVYYFSLEKHMTIRI